MTAIWLLINVYPPKQSPGSLLQGLDPAGWEAGALPSWVSKAGEPQSNFKYFVKKVISSNGSSRIH